jgi:4-amino-4-deoxy-L-arabinose transferase-like glycosyltransferase
LVPERSAARSGTSSPVSVENSSDPLPLLFLAIPVFFLFLAANSIWDANEAFYVETPKQMVVTGDYVTPVFNGAERLNKPVLSYWIVAAFYQVLGISVGVERLAIALGALGIVAATFLVGRALGGKATGVWAALIVATAPRFVFFSRRIFIDVYITLFMSLTLAFFVLAERYPERRRLFLYLMYAAIGLGVLTKGPIALGLPALVGLIWLARERRLSDLRRLSLVPGALIVLAIVVPWWAAIYNLHGAERVVDFWIGENLGRYGTTITADRPFWFFLGVLFADVLMPWAPLLVVPFLTGWRPASDGEAPAHASLRRLLCLWIAVIVAVFSFSASKEDLYILPVVPAAAALIADALVRSGFGAQSRAVRAAFVIVCVICLAFAVAVAFYLRTGPYAIPGWTFVVTALAAAGAAGLILGGARRWSTAFSAFAVALIALNYVLVARALPAAEPLKPVPPIARVLEQRASPGSRLGSYNMSLPSVVYYVGRPVPELSFDLALSLLAAPEEAWLITGGDEWEELRPRVPATCIAERRHLFPFDRITPANVLNSVPPKAVLLVTNRCGK